MMDIRDRIDPGADTMTGSTGHRGPGPPCRSAVGLGRVTVAIGADNFIIGTAVGRSVAMGALCAMYVSYHIRDTRRTVQGLIMTGVTTIRARVKVAGMAGGASCMTKSAVAGHVLGMIVMNSCCRICDGWMAGQAGRGRIKRSGCQCGVTIDTVGRVADDSSVKSTGRGGVAGRSLTTMYIVNHLRSPGSTISRCIMAACCITTVSAKTEY